jgi:hypothetical protein
MAEKGVLKSAVPFSKSLTLTKLVINVGYRLIIKEV